jgi:hypothetical protein
MDGLMTIRIEIYAALTEEKRQAILRDVMEAVDSNLPSSDYPDSAVEWFHDYKEKPKGPGE